jgi:chemotaxis protein MotB
MEESSIRSGQVSQVRGFADRNLRDKENPDAPSNRRISVIVRYLPQSPASPAPAEPAPAEHASH